jgi:hypothetical protein
MRKDPDSNPDLNSDLKNDDFAISDESIVNESLIKPSVINPSLTNKSLDNETTRLLSELDRAIDHSSTLRNLIRRQEALLELESITGCSRKTLTLRLEITRLQQQLCAGRGDDAAASNLNPGALKHASRNF